MYVAILIFTHAHNVHVFYPYSVSAGSKVLAWRKCSHIIILWQPNSI